MVIEEWDGDASRPLISSLRDAVYPPEVLATIVWRNVTSDRAQRRILVKDDGAVVATAGVIWRAGYLDDAPVRLGGIGGVMTKPESQGLGFGRAAVEAACRRLVRDRSPAFGVLFCEEKNVGFYEKLGWRRFGGAVFVQQPMGRMAYEIMPTMVAPLGTSAPQHGRLDLAGLPW